MKINFALLNINMLEYARKRKNCPKKIGGVNNNLTIKSDL